MPFFFFSPKSFSRYHIVKTSGKDEYCRPVFGTNVKVQQKCRFFHKFLTRPVCQSCHSRCPAELFSRLYPRACCVSLRPWFIDYMFTFVILSLKTLPSHWSGLHLYSDLLRFCSNCVLALRFFVVCTDFPALEIQLLPSHSGCSCSLTKPRLSGFFFSALGFIFFLCSDPVKNVVWANIINLATLWACSPDFLERPVQAGTLLNLVQRVALQAFIKLLTVHEYKM